MLFFEMCRTANSKLICVATEGLCPSVLPGGEDFYGEDTFGEDIFGEDTYTA